MISGPAAGRLPRRVVHLPFEAGPHRMAMGLTPAAADDLVELDDHTPADMALRRDLLDTRRSEVLATGADRASGELLALVAELLPRRFPGVFRRDGDRLTDHLAGECWELARPALHPLEIVGRLVPEDFCLLTEDAVLDAAVLCFPSRWRLADKIGRRLDMIHDDVPGYGERLAGPVDRFLRHLRPGRLAQRLNWSVLDDASLFQPTGKWAAAPNPAVTPANAGETLVLRTERQTLSRLSTHVLFAIRVRVTRLSEAITRPADAARLAAAVRALPPAMAHYKSLPAIEAPLLAWLDARADMIGGEAVGGGRR